MTLVRGESRPSDVEWADLLAEIKDQVGYPEEVPDVTGQVLYKNALEERLASTWAELANAVTLLESIADGVPCKDDWRSAASFMESVAAKLDAAGIPRPDHYRE